MLSHSGIWAAIDALAYSLNLTASGLARKAGLDPTTFNPSKRNSPDGRARWPSTESIAKVLQSTNTSIDSFINLMIEKDVQVLKKDQDFTTLPLIEFSQAGVGSFFDDGGSLSRYERDEYEEITFPGSENEKFYALEIFDESMMPLYRNGDVIIVYPGAKVKSGDRIILKTVANNILAGVLQKNTSKIVEYLPFNSNHANAILKKNKIKWLAKILWASQ